MNTSPAIAMEEFQQGQIWKMEGSQLEVGIVGRHLVHYKLTSSSMKRSPNSLSNKEMVRGFLLRNKAVLVR